MVADGMNYYDNIRTRIVDMINSVSVTHWRQEDDKKLPLFNFIDMNNQAT